MKRVLEWQIATVTAIKNETENVKTFTLALPNWTPHRAGQHYDLRLVAPDGYEAQRSYSVASEPERVGEIDVTVERLEDGEVSSYLDSELMVGDQIEVRGPIGGYFVWDVAMGGPLLLIAGGSGVVPLMAMLRHRAAAGAMVPTRLLYSVASLDDSIYRDELSAMQHSKTGVEIIFTFTRKQPPGWHGYARRIDATMLSDLITPFEQAPLSYICGPSAFVETAANTLAHLGIPPTQIRTERFGPSSS